MSPEEKLQYCQSVIQEQQDSGLSVSKWCHEQGIPKTRYYRYKRILEGDSGSANTDNKEEGGFYKVPDLNAVPTQDQRIMLEVGGVKLHIGDDANWEMVSSILRTLQGTC